MAEFNFSDPLFHKELRNGFLYGIGLFVGFMLINHFTMDHAISQQNHLQNFTFWICLGIVLGLVKYFLGQNQKSSKK